MSNAFIGWQYKFQALNQGKRYTAVRVVDTQGNVDPTPPTFRSVLTPTPTHTANDFGTTSRRYKHPPKAGV